MQLVSMLTRSLYNAVILVESALSTDPGSSPRKYSYEEITANTEKSIRLLLSQSENDRSIRDAWIAYGLYLAWTRLTVGRRTPEDDGRLHNLARRIRER